MLLSTSSPVRNGGEKKEPLKLPHLLSADARDRFFENGYQQSGQPANEYSIQTRRTRFLQEINRTIGVIQRQMPPTISKAHRTQSGTVYEGFAGIAYLFLRLHLAQKAGSFWAEDSKGEQKQELRMEVKHQGRLKSVTHARKPYELATKLLELGNMYLDQAISLAPEDDDDISFLKGRSGVLALSAVYHHLAGQRELCQKSIEELLAMHDTALRCEDCTLITGKAGYLYSLLFVNKYIDADTIEARYIITMARSIMEQGQKESKSCQYRSPLIFESQGKRYLGAGRGLGGILHVLLHCPLSLNSEEQPSETHLSAEEVHCIKASLDFLLQSRFDSLNYPTTDNEMEDDCGVQWCHGAPGMTLLFARAHQVLDSALPALERGKYLRATESAADVVWQRGLLKKGVGLCHGVAGNGYALLTAYRLTHKYENLHRALCFADFASHWQELVAARELMWPDNPYSLFEGLAGAACLFLDVINPENSQFPAFEL